MCIPLIESIELLHNLIRSTLGGLLSHTTLTLSRHYSCSTFRQIAVSILPIARHGLCLREEQQAWLSVECQHASSGNALLVPRETERWDRNWNWYVQTNLSCLDVLLEMIRGSTGACKYCCTVTVFVLVDQFDCFV